MAHSSFVTTTRGLLRDTPPMVLYEKAKRLGIWNPSEIDFTKDKLDWPEMSEMQRDAVLRLTALFQAGEEAVTSDIMPLMEVIAKQGRLEEELFLTTFLFEEGKHTDFFNRFLLEVVPDAGDLTRYHSDCYRTLFYDALPTAMHALREDSSPEALVRAATTYNLIVEGVVAETGYHAYFLALDKGGVMPGTRKGITLLKQDEARHITYGIFLISRLMAEDPSLWDVVNETMGELMELTMNLISEIFLAYPVPPFGIGMEEFTDFAARQFQKRLDRISRSRTLSLDQVYTEAHTVIAEEVA